MSLPRQARWSAPLCGIGFVAIVLSLAGSNSRAQTTDPGVHDPVMIKAGDSYYLFCTGRGIEVWSSPDRKTWSRKPSVFAHAPDWVREMLPQFRNHIWAPDIVEHHGTYYLYYSVSAFGRNNSAIGVATNTTLDADDPDYRWQDHGPVVRSVPGRDMWNAIDPAVAFDADGTPWLAFGSFWSGLKICCLADSLTELSQPQEWRSIAARHRYWKLDELDAGDSANPELDYDRLYSKKLIEMNQASASSAIEAPFLFRHGDYYYLFASWDRCCRGLASTYKVVVGRSTHIKGPYVDRAGEPMLYGGGSLVVYGVPESNRWAALGHNAVYTFDGVDYLVCHGYDKQDEGRSKLVLEPIEWDEYGWPVVRLENEEPIP